MFTTILSHTPVWVWGLLAGLAALGLAQTRTRRIGRGRLLLMPLALLALGAWSLAHGAAVQPLAVLAWANALAVGTLLGWRIAPPAGARWLAGPQQLQLPGSWLPLALMLGVFCLRYAASAALALQPAWQTTPAATLAVPALFGTLAGLMLGRTLRLLQLTRSAVPTPVAPTMFGHA